MIEMLRDLHDLFPRRMHAHLSPGVIEALRPDFEPFSVAPHLRMLLTNPQALREIELADTIRLTAHDLPALRALYEDVYAGAEDGGNVVHELMLDLGPSASMPAATCSPWPVSTSAPLSRASRPSPTSRRTRMNAGEAWHNRSPRRSAANCCRSRK